MSCASDGHDTDEELSRLEQLLGEEGQSEGDVSETRLLDDDTLLGLGEAEKQPRVKPAALSKPAKDSTPVSTSLQPGGSTPLTRHAPTRGKRTGQPLAGKTTEAVGGREGGKVISLNRKSSVVRYVPESLPQVELPQLARQPERVKKEGKGGHRPYGRYFSAPSLLLEQPSPPKIPRQSADLRGIITGNRMKKASRLGSHQGSSSSQAQPSFHSPPSRVVRESEEDWDYRMPTSHQRNRTASFPDTWSRLPSSHEWVESDWLEGEGLSGWGEHTQQPWEATQCRGGREAQWCGGREPEGERHNGVDRSDEHLFTVDSTVRPFTPPTTGGRGLNPFVPHSTLPSHVTDTSSATPTGISHGAPHTVSFNVFGPSTVPKSSPSKATADHCLTSSHHLQPMPTMTVSSLTQPYNQQAGQSNMAVRSIFAQRPGIVPLSTSHSFTLKHLRTDTSAKLSFSLDHL